MAASGATRRKRGREPYALFDGRRWLLWYNGRRGGVEQIGRALHAGADLGFGRPLTPNAR
jgi:hypothetical protein